MSDASATDWTESTYGHVAGTAALMPSAIDRILADFRCWLEQAEELPQHDAADAGLENLVAQFTALRHEVNLQTRASRTLAERAGQLLEKTESEPPPHLKALLDVADVLALAAKRMEELGSVDERPAELIETAAPPTAGWLGRMLGTHRGWAAWQHRMEQWHAVLEEEAAMLRDRLCELSASAADGYAMSVRKVERLLAELGVEPVSCVGLPFDPEVMEAIELGDGPSGIVLEEIRRGYRCNGRLIRYAQVRVAR